MTERPLLDAAPEAVVAPWRRLDPRMLVVTPVSTLVRLVPVLVIVLVTGAAGDPTRYWTALGIAVVAVLVGVLRWRTTRYRITPERVELHSGWLRVQRRSVPRDRIRTVDLTASPLHRLVGLSVVQVGAASAAGESGGLSLDAVSREEAGRLRRELLQRVAPGAPAAVAAPPAAELARLDWSWLRYAPLTFSSLAGIGAAGAALFNLAGELGIGPRDLGDAAGRLLRVSLWVGVTLAAVALLVVAVVGSLLLFAERWYDYRLTREPDGTLRVRRGLLTRRSLSVSEERLRGAEISEPLLLRAGRGAQARALTTGLGRESGSGALQPPAPRGEAHRVAAVALREEPAQATTAPLLRHPRAARRRRLVRTLVPAAVVVAVAWWVGAATGTGWLGPASLLLLPLGVALALDRYRNLGHQLTARYIVSRAGSLQRRTVAVQRAGVIGLTVRQSVFQRRAGVVSVEVVTAAGQGGYEILDVAAADGVALADAATPGVVGRFRTG